MRAGRPRRGRRAGEALARPRPPGHEGVRLPQGPRRGRPPPRPRSARPPQLRAADGTWSDASWDEAIAHTATRLAAITAEHGERRGRRVRRQPDGVQRARPRCTSARCCARSASGARSRRARRTAPTSSSPARPCSARRTVHPIPDLEHTDLCLIIGENPRASQASFYSIPNVLGRAAPGHGSRARASCSSTRAASRRPSAASATRCSSGPTPTCGSSPRCCTRSTALGGFDARRHRPPRHATSTGCARSSPRYPADRVADVTGVDADVDPRAGRGLGGHAAGLGARIDRHQHGPPGHAGLLARAHAVVRHRPPRRRGRQPEERRLLPQRPRRAPASPSRATSTPSSAGCGAGSLPGTLMADAILDSDEPVRAMIVVAGNPLLSIAGQERLRKAFEQLELLVVIDIYPSATAELAHVLLPSHRHVRARRPQHRQHRHQRPAVRAVHAGRGRRRRPSASPSGGSPTACCRSSGSRRCSTTPSTRPVVEVAAHAGARQRASTLADLQADRRRRACCPPRRPASSSTRRCTRPTVWSTAARRRSPRPSSAATACSTRRRAGASRRPTGCG